MTDLNPVFNEATNRQTAINFRLTKIKYVLEDQDLIIDRLMNSMPPSVERGNLQFTKNKILKLLSELDQME